MSDPSEVYNACRLSDTLFAMNPFLPQQNFYSQQLRALALVAAIQEIHLLPGRRNVCVVGAGVAGRMLAAAFVTVGASVSLVEKRHKPFEQYRNAGHRELHPNIIFWPSQTPTPVTALPFLNWAQASADDVVKELFLEWKSGFGKKVRQIEAEVLKIVHDDDGVRLDLSKGASIEADLCVLATGFEKEQPFGKLNSPGYWSPMAVCDEGNSFLVSGSGDGGLIDVLSPILGTRVTKAAHVLATAIGDSALTKDVAATEAERSAKLIAGDRDSSDPCKFYDKVFLSSEVAAEIDELAESSQQLEGRVVTLLHKSTSPYSYTAAPINKLLLAHFSNGANAVVKSAKGALKQVGDTHVMHLEDGTDSCVDPPSFDKVTVRHGARPAAKKLLSDREYAQLQKLADEYPGSACVTGYDRKLFKWTKHGMGRSGVTLSTMHETVKRSLQQLGLTYELDIVPGAIKDQSFTSGTSIEVNLDAKDRIRAEALKLFPMKLGPAKVIVKPRSITRNAPYADEA